MSFRLRLHLEELPVYVPGATFPGAIGPLDLQRRIEPDEGPPEAVTASSSALELGAYRCSLEFAATMRANNVPYTDGFRLIGTHTWAYWEQDLPAAWRTVSRGLY